MPIPVQLKSMPQVSQPRFSSFLHAAQSSPTLDKANQGPQGWALVFALIATLTAGMSLPLVTASAGVSCGELLTDRCQKCHYLTRVCQKIEKAQQESSWFSGFSNSWGRTVKNMVSQGAKLNDAEQQQLIDCLKEPAADILDLCEKNK